MSLYFPLKIRSPFRIYLIERRHGHQEGLAVEVDLVQGPVVGAEDKLDDFLAARTGDLDAGDAVFSGREAGAGAFERHAHGIAATTTREIEHDFEFQHGCRIL